MFPSKADRILSRYRPIAPKPAAFPPPAAASFASDPSSSCASLDSFASRPLSEPSKFKRPRKRRSDVSSSPKPPSKFVKSDRSQVRPGGGVPVGGGVFSAGGSSLTPGTSDGAVPDLDRRCLSQASLPSPCMSLGDDSVDASRPVLCDKVGPLDPGTTGFGGGGDPGLPFVKGNAAHDGMARGQRMSPPVYFGGTGIFEKDVAFMERAAANAPSSVLQDKAMGAETTSKSGAYVGGFTEMIRGITRLPTAADVHSLMQVRMASESRSFSSVPSSVAHDSQRRSTVPQVASPPGGVGRDFATGSPEAENEPSCSYFKLVTLPLLPDTPSLADSQSSGSSLTSCTIASALSRGCERYNASVAGSGQLGLGLFGGLRSSGGSSPAAVDQVYLEQVYGGSTDPVLLLDDSQLVLWFNRAYERASKSTSDRNLSGPYIDPLGHPTPLGSFTLHSFGKPTNSSATLWGFLKKLVQESELLNDESDGFCSSAFPSNDAGSSEQVSELSLRLGDADLLPTEKQSLKSTGVGSSLSTGSNMPANLSLLSGCIATLESVTEIDRDAIPMSEVLEAVEARLQLQGSRPSFITDCSNRVTWVNSAYRKLVDLRGLWLASSASGGGRDVFDSQVTTLCLGQKIPDSAAAFSGRVNLQWIKAGVKSSMTLPCDVCRLILDAGVEMWVWKFDVAASLGLTCGTLS